MLDRRIYGHTFHFHQVIRCDPMPKRCKMGLCFYWKI
jgi:murein endopeptidase